MSFWSKPSTTSALLGVIAILLLVQVVQNTKRAPGPSFAPPQAQLNNPHMMPPGEEGFEQGEPGTMPEGHPPTGGGPKSDNMMYAALACPDDPTMTLADPGCNGSTAEERKKMVLTELEKGEPIGKMFDEIISRYGESALTAEAMNIRKMRRSAGAKPPAN